MASRSKPLTRERVLREATTIADKHGIESLSMRKLGQKLGVEAMSLYNHVANKDDLLDGLVDLVVAEIELPKKGSNWKEAMRIRAHSAREMFLRHPWALIVMESRKNPGPNSMRYYDAVIGCLNEGGFSIALTAHAFAALDSYIYGFALQEMKLPFKTSSELTEVATNILQQMPADEYPHFVKLTTEHVMKPGYSFADEFEFGLELMLDGLERCLKRR
ncbi:MAG: TetR/AcrR family transcriptional regulator C-terminal domain-containing protein [Planctomycetes bacterium]|nr:TetR/AcrR family transcriptional regulator C-terminal domain-containing protein [Planctomycetota bacterium]